MIQTVGNSSLETANQLLQQGKIQEAVAEYRRGIELTPDLSWHHYYLGEALTQLEDWEGAAQAYRQAIALGSNYLCYYRLGVALVKLELWDEAIATLNKGLELKPDYYKFYLPLGQALVHQQHWEAAIEAYGKAVALKPEVAEFNLQLGQLLRRQGRFTEAVGYLQRAADFQGDDPQLQLGLGVALVEARTDLHRAEASLRRTLELQPDQGEAYFYLGKLEGLRGRWDEALAMYRRSWEINPQVSEWGLALAEALEKLGRWSKAVDQYRQVVLELGESGEASLGLGRALVQLGRPVEAVVEFRRAVELGVDKPEVHRLWAEVLVKLGRWSEVVDQWKWLVERYPGAADVRRRLALALMGLGRWPEAAAQWGEYWRVAPGSGRGPVMDFRRELRTYGEIDHRQELSITGDLTVEFWLYLRRWPESWTEIISKFVSDEQNEFCFRLKDGQRAQWYFGKGEAFAKPVDWVPQEDMRLHEWVHVACVRKVGEYGRIYFDGVLRREEDWSGEPEAAGTEATVRLMAHSDGKRFNDGKLSEVRIWNCARSEDEIRQGMYEALTGDEPGLVGVWYGSDDGVLVDAVGHHDGRSVMADGGKERPRVGVCGWELSHNAAGRAYTLAQLYGGWAEVELIGCLFPRYGGQVWEPIRGAEIPCHTVTVANEGRFVEQALGLVLAHPYEVVHLSKPRIPNIVLGLLYKLVWGARVIVDIDDEELAFVKAEGAVDWRELPPLRDLDSQEWTEIAAGLAREFDRVRELDGAEAGDAEAGELLAAVVAEVLAVPGCGVSQGLGLLLQGLPAVESVKSALGVDKLHSRNWQNVNETIVRVWKPDLFCAPTEFLTTKGLSKKIKTSISKIVILTCVWKRPELTQVVLSYYEYLKRELAGKINLELLAVGSEGEISRSLCQRCGFDYLEYPNEPLSGKWEYGLNRCADYDPDAVIIVGSDDIISQNLIEFYAGQIQDGLVFCGLKDGYFLDLMNRKLYWWMGYGDKVDYKRVGETIGMGRCLSRTLLDKLGFSIWKGLDINLSLDRAMTARLQELGLHFSDYYNCVLAQVEGKWLRIGHAGLSMADIGACAVDIKISENITPLTKYLSRDASVLVPQPDPWEVLQRYFPDDIVIKKLKGLASVKSDIQDIQHIAVKPTELQTTVKQINPEQELLERKTKKLGSQIKLLKKQIANLLSWRYGSITPGRKDWEEKWDKSPGKRILYFTPIDYSGSFYEWATAVNRYTEYAVRLITLQFHEFGYLQDLVMPIPNQCEESIRTIISEADTIHIKDELGFFEEGKARNQLPLNIFTDSGKPLIYTLYGAKARRFCHDYYYRDHVNSFDVAVAMTPDLAYPWIERCYFVPHSVDVEVYPYDWRDGKTISHSPSSPSRKGTELFLEAIEKLDPSLQVKLNLIQGVSHAECIVRKRKSTLFFDQAGWQKSKYPGKHLTIGWYGNSALEAMVHGIPTIAHLDNAALDNAERMRVDMRKKCPVINVPMIYQVGGVEGMKEKIEHFFRLSVDERKELSLKTRKWVEDFHSYEVNSQQLAEIYGRLLNSAPIKNTALSCSIQ